MAEMEHKRTRSMRSLLQRSSRTDLSKSKDDPSSPRSDAGSPTSSSQSHPLAQVSVPQASIPQISMDGSPKPPPAQPQPAYTSIEQSVRIFKVYEALRRGDTAAISRAIGESTSTAEGESRASTSMLAGGGLEGTSILHLAVQCADQPVIEFVLSNPAAAEDINTRDKDGNTPLHVAASLGRAPTLRLLLQQKDVNDTLHNYDGQTPLDLAKTPEVFQQLQLAKSMYIDSHVKQMQKLVADAEYDKIEELLMDEHFKSAIDVDRDELATDPSITESGGTLLHEASKKKDHKLIQILLLNGADPFRRDRKGKLPQDVTKDDKTKAILKKSPAAAAAQRGIQERTILGPGGPKALTGSATGADALGGKEGREMKGYLKKWVNYTTGYKLRWFVLEDGVLSYYKHQDDAGSACRGAINMKIAQLHMDSQDHLRFEVMGKSSVKYHLKANHQVEAKRWVWALNNAIQFAKDEAKEVAKTQSRNTEMLRQAKIAQAQGSTGDSSSQSGVKRTGTNLSVPGTTVPGSATGLERVTSNRSGVSGVSDVNISDDAASLDQSIAGDDVARIVNSHGTTAIEGDHDEDEEYGDDASEIEAHPVRRDAFVIAAHSARLQLDMLSQISSALQNAKQVSPETTLSDSHVSQAFDSYDSAVANLNGLIMDLGRIARDREAFWQYRLEQELNVRRIWEDNMLKVAQDQEELENSLGESEEKRKEAKRALREVLESQAGATEAEVGAARPETPAAVEERPTTSSSRKSISSPQYRKKSTIADLAEIAASDDEDNDEEFFDAVDAGEVEVVDELPPDYQTESAAKTTDGAGDIVAIKSSKARNLASAYKGYEEPLRKRLKMDADNRPKISLWGILKSMIGKDMTKMTLPVSFNEPTSLLQRVAEDLEYTPLLDTAAERSDPTERMLYVAAFAASEYASTIGRVAKPFNPLLGETYEYVRPDRGYRFFIEQVSHHPPIGAAWAESAHWDYYGESAVKSKFYGKAFDINPLGTWFLKLRPTFIAEKSTTAPKEELYTWKKVTSSVIGIITGSPTVDNYGTMSIKNHTSNETCILEFKPRGWKASSAFQVNGKVLDADGRTRWSVGGRWNDKIYARLTPGFEDVDVSSGAAAGGGGRKDENKAFLIWEANKRPPGVPFNLPPFALTLNALTPTLRPHLPPTDTRLRPDQRAMEDGEYDLAASEKNRVEEKQRAARRVREVAGEEFEPRWFRRGVCGVSGEEFWVARGSREDIESGGGQEGGDVEEGVKGGKGGLAYWNARERGEWTGSEDIF